MCWYCGSTINDPEPIGRSLRCAECGRDLRCCRNCRHFIARSGTACAESVSEIPADKERANFCDWFSLNPRLRMPSSGAGAELKAEKAAKSAFDALFSE